MSDEQELEVFKLPEGDEVKTGLTLAAPGEVMPMAEYPDEMLLERSDIKRSLSGDFYKQERQRTMRWMINQARLGKCNPSANIGAIDQVRDNAGMPHEALSDNHLYWRVNGGADVGSSLISTYKEIQKGGASRRTITVNGKTYVIPGDVYNRRQIPVAAADAADVDGKLFLAFEAYLLPKTYDRFKITVASALARRQPIVWAWHVSNAGMRLRNGYLIQGNGPGNHSNCAQSAKFVDGDDIVHPDDRNSWGPTQDPIYGPTGSGWGEGGYGLVTMQDFFHCSRYHDFYVVTSVKQRPDQPII